MGKGERAMGWNKAKTMNNAFIIFASVGLYFASFHNYLLFHSVAEIFSICIAFTIYIITWNSKEFIKGNFLMVIGIAYLFIGFLDLIHTLSFKGMSIFKDYDYYANQLWIATRLMESITILLSFVMINFKKNLSVYLIFVIYLFITIGILMSIFTWKIFPICFIDNVGQTKFKIVSEYVISFILLSSLGFSYYYKKHFDKSIYKYVVLSIVFTIFSELSFIFYISNYGISNMIGHYLKIISFYLIYKAVIEKGIKEPQRSIFRELQNQVNTDGLTGLFTHRYLYEKLDEEIKRTLRTNNQFSIILFDVDHFKKINDQFGHVVGDEALFGIGNTIKTLTRATDVVGRYGGEEFMVILPNTDIKKCFHTAEKIRIKIGESTYCQNKVKITVSAGIAAFNATYEIEKSKKIASLASDLVNIADAHLYKAKQDGRNRTVG